MWKLKICRGIMRMPGSALLLGFIDFARIILSRKLFVKIQTGDLSLDVRE